MPPRRDRKRKGSNRKESKDSSHGKNIEGNSKSTERIRPSFGKRPKRTNAEKKEPKSTQEDEVIPEMSHQGDSAPQPDQARSEVTCHSSQSKASAVKLVDSCVNEHDVDAGCENASLCAEPTKCLDDGEQKCGDEGPENKTISSQVDVVIEMNNSDKTDKIIEIIGDTHAQVKAMNDTDDTIKIQNLKENKNLDSDGKDSDNINVADAQMTKTTECVVKNDALFEANQDDHHEKGNVQNIEGCADSQGDVKQVNFGENNSRIDGEGTLKCIDADSSANESNGNHTAVTTCDGLNSDKASSKQVMVSTPPNSPENNKNKPLKYVDRTVDKLNEQSFIETLQEIALDNNASETEQSAPNQMPNPTMKQVDTRQDTTLVPCHTSNDHEMAVEPKYSIPQVADNACTQGTLQKNDDTVFKARMAEGSTENIGLNPLVAPANEKMECGAVVEPAPENLVTAGRGLSADMNLTASQLCDFEQEMIEMTQHPLTINQRQSAGDHIDLSNDTNHCNEPPSACEGNAVLQRLTTQVISLNATLARYKREIDLAKKRHVKYKNQ